MKIILFSLLVLATSCKSQKDSVENNNEGNRLTLLVQDGYFFTDSTETSVIRDEKTLKVLFSRINRTRKPGLPVPKIDFTKEMVLVVCMGKQETTAMPYLKMLRNSDKEIVIGVKTKAKPDKQEQITSYPFCIYKMPISKNKVIFKQL